MNRLGSGLCLVGQLGLAVWVNASFQMFALRVHFTVRYIPSVAGIILTRRSLFLPQRKPQSTQATQSRQQCWGGRHLDFFYSEEQIRFSFSYLIAEKYR